MNVPGLRVVTRQGYFTSEAPVSKVAVAPKARRHGIGTRMMQAAETVCQERGASAIRLEVSTKNLVAIEFYRRLGYRTDGVLYGYYSWGEDAYSMHKPIVPMTAPAETPPLTATSHPI